MTILQWPGLRSEYSWIPPHNQVTVSTPHQIGVSFTDHHQVVQDRDGTAARIDVTAGMVFATGPQAVTWAEVREPTEVVEIHPGRELLADELEPVSGANDPVVLAVAATLKRVHLGTLALDDLQASTLSHLLVTHLAAHYCGSRPPRSSLPGRLDRAQLGKVACLIEDRLTEPLRLDDLAAAAGLSPYHFARAFKASTGVTPHQFVTMRRMERAKSVLLGTRLSMMEVAHRAGFSNLSHFRRTFRLHTGYQPSALRSN